jgi:nucleotide-binding universal stress UspA family protein
MYRTILVPLDGSPCAERALTYACQVARSSGARVRMLRACISDPPRHLTTDPGPVLGVQEVETYLGDLMTRLTVGRETAGVTFELASFPIDATSAILREVVLQPVDLIVMCPHGAACPSATVFGPVAEQLVRWAEVPVLVVPTNCAPCWPTARRAKVMVTHDGSELADVVLAPARELAENLRAGMFILRVVDMPARSESGENRGESGTARDLAEAWEHVRSLAKNLSFSSLSVFARVESGDAAKIIAAVGSVEHADIIAMATHGQGGQTSSVIGSVAAAIVQTSSVPVLLVRPPALKQSEQDHPKVTAPRMDRLGSSHGPVS